MQVSCNPTEPFVEIYIKIENAMKNIPTHKSNSLAALPCNPNFAAKHLLLFQRTRYFKNNTGYKDHALRTIIHNLPNGYC